jgi:hypothetical protein
MIITSNRPELNFWPKPEPKTGYYLIYTLKMLKTTCAFMENYQTIKENFGTIRFNFEPKLRPKFQTSNKPKPKFRFRS